MESKMESKIRSIKGYICEDGNGDIYLDFIEHDKPTKSDIAFAIVAGTAIVASTVMLCIEGREKLCQLNEKYKITKKVKNITDKTKNKIQNIFKKKGT